MTNTAPRFELARPWSWRDAASVRPGDEYAKTRRIERSYAARLRAVAVQVGRLIEAFPDPTQHPESAGKIAALLARYSETLDPWAQAAAARMVSEVNFQNERAWLNHGRTMGREMAREIAGAPTGEYARQRLAENVHLIKSLPTEAAARVHRLTLEALADSTRAREIAKEIARSGEVTSSRATLIARTEVARTASAMTEARAVHIGSESYIWRTARDEDVRPSHRDMEGKTVKWSDPPTLDNMTGHAGCFPNCRCYPEPVIPRL